MSRFGGGRLSKPPLSVTDFKPRAPVHPSAPIIISPKPQRKASYTGGEIFDLSSLQGSTVAQTTGALGEGWVRGQGVGKRKWEGGGKGSERAIMRE